MYILEVYERIDSDDCSGELLAEKRVASLTFNIGIILEPAATVTSFQECFRSWYKTADSLVVYSMY